MAQDDDRANVDDNALDLMGGMSANMKVMLDTAVITFQKEWGQEIRAQRERAEAMGMPPGFVAQMLPMVGISLSTEEIVQIEEGTFTNIDTRLLLAMAMVLEVRVDKPLLAALKQGALQERDTGT